MEQCLVSNKLERGNRVVENTLQSCTTANQVRETLAITPSQVNQINGELGNGDSHTVTVQGNELMRCLLPMYSAFKRQDGYPQEKMNYLSCPVLKREPERYGSARKEACRGYGFKDISALK